MIPLCRSQSVLTGQFPEGQKASWASLGLEAGGGFSWLNIHVSSQPGGAWQLHLLLLFQDPWLWGLGAGGGKTALGMRGSPPSHAEANHNERKEQGSQMETEVPEGLQRVWHTQPLSLLFSSFYIYLKPWSIHKCPSMEEGKIWFLICWLWIICWKSCDMQRLLNLIFTVSTLSPG